VDIVEPKTENRTEPAVAPRDRSRRLSRPAQIGILLIVAAALAGVALLVLVNNHPAEEAASSTEVSGDMFHPTQAQWAGFHIAPVQPAAFRPTTDADGQIATDDDLTTPVFSPYSGRVVRVFARPGDRIKAGQPLFAVQASELVQGQNDLVAAAATLKTARAQLGLAETNEHRQHELYLSHGAALKDWQQAQVDLATAQGAVNTAQVALTAVRNRLRILGRTDSEINAIEGAPDLQSLDPVATVVAPIDGIVIQRQVGLGQNIVSAAGGASTPQFQIGDLSKVWLVANLREEDAPRVHIGDVADVRVPAWPDRVFQARIAHVASSIDPTTHRLLVRAEIGNPDGALKPEMLARFRIVTGAPTEALAVPVGALVYEGADVHVWVANPADHAIALRQIKIGQVGDGVAEVLSGLKPGEQVATAGSLFLDRAVTGD
jgi:cobalt-zinc-cadmium efflux system membrane fusion protein